MAFLLTCGESGACCERTSIASDRRAVKRACLCACQRASHSTMARSMPEALGSRTFSRSNIEKTTEICCGCGGHFFCSQVSHSGDGLCYFGDMGGFVALAAEALRREEWRVRFDQNFLEGQGFRNVTNVGSFRIGCIACEGD